MSRGLRPPWVGGIFGVPPPFGGTFGGFLRVAVGRGRSQRRKNKTRNGRKTGQRKAKQSERKSGRAPDEGRGVSRGFWGGWGGGARFYGGAEGAEVLGPPSPGSRRTGPTAAVGAGAGIKTGSGGSGASPRRRHRRDRRPRGGPGIAAGSDPPWPLFREGLERRDRPPERGANSRRPPPKNLPIQRGCRDPPNRTRSRRAPQNPPPKSSAPPALGRSHAGSVPTLKIKRSGGDGAGEAAKGPGLLRGSAGPPR